MVSFDSDYNNGAHPLVLRRLMETNDERTATYGFDVYTERAKEKIRSLCKMSEADVFLLAGGTQTNATVIDAVLRSYEAVLSADTGHIYVHEAGAVRLLATKSSLYPASMPSSMRKCFNSTWRPLWAMRVAITWHSPAWFTLPSPRKWALCTALLRSKPSTRSAASTI